MGRLHSIAELTLLLGLFCLCTPPVRADGACSLVVRVLLPDGRRPHVPITVVEQSGRVDEKHQEDHDVRFCDLGILPVTVKVGSAGMCNQTAIENVPMSFGESYLLLVTYDALACVDTVRPPVPLCQVLFRVSDTTGTWMPNLPITLSSPVQRILRTDQFGRAFFGAKSGDKIVGSLTSLGLRDVNFGWECSPSDPRHEENIKLEKR
jgi:hypothetical protein